MNGRWLKIATAAKYMDVSEQTVRRKIASGILHMHTSPLGPRLDREEIDGLFSHVDTQGCVVTADEERLFVRRKIA